MSNDYDALYAYLQGINSDGQFIQEEGRERYGRRQFDDAGRDDQAVIRHGGASRERHGFGVSVRPLQWR